MSLIFATQLTAMATTVLAVFAVVTAVFAFLAFRKQSQEIAAIEQQVRDEQELVKQQAGLLEVQSGQLELQRRQLEEQREVNKLQVKDLRESLEERDRHRQVAEREQADNITFQMSAMPFPRSVEDADEDFPAIVGREVHVAIISNESRRPIVNVVCRIGEPPALEILDAHNPYAVMVGRLAPREPGEQQGPHMLIDAVPRSNARRIRPGETYGLVFEISSHRVLDLVMVAVRFTDDVGHHWQIDRDLHLEQLPDRDW